MSWDYLKLKQANCKNCYRCIRNCPVKAISFSDHQARILDEDCILCGQCFVACPQQAKEVRGDLDTARRLISSDVPVYASLAPSFAANYPGVSFESMERALKGLGFSGAEQTALGATMVKKRYDELVTAGEQRVIITSCCHSVTMLLQKHFPQALPFLAPVLSPMQAHGLDIKKKHPGAATVFIGPCVSKKAEAEQYPGAIDCVLTFEELSAWLAKKGLTPEPGPVGAKTGRAGLFPIGGGILRSMYRPNQDYAYLSVDGVENCVRAIRDILNGDLDKCFIEMSACVGSCVGGPVMEKNRNAPIRDYVAINSYAGGEDFPLDQPPAEELAKTFTAERRPKLRISEGAILEVLRKTGKTRPEDELNCGTCGYGTCREKAVAVVLGKADISMCLPFLKEKAESFSDTIITNTPNGVVVLSEALVVQQINQAACRILNLREPEDILGSHVVRVLDPEIFAEAMESHAPIYNRPAYLAEYQRHVRQSVIHDANYHILILIMRDVTEEEHAHAHNSRISRQTVEVADQVIEKQMRVVQEIASLLGETAAETKIALSLLKESLDRE